MTIQYSETSEWYGEYIKHELDRLEANKFRGNVTFRVDCVDGVITGISLGMNKCVRMPKQ